MLCCIGEWIRISDTAIFALEPAMLQLKINSSAPIWASYYQIRMAVRDQLRAQAANTLRLLILVLVGLLFVLLGLMLLTGRVEIGGPILGSVLLISFGAAQFGR
jgi:hypothetical protein